MLLAKRSRLAGVALLAAGILCWTLAIAIPQNMAVAATSLRLLPNNMCSDRIGDEILVCAARVNPRDILSLQALADCIVQWERISSQAALSSYIRTRDPSRFKNLLVSDHSCPSYGTIRASPVLLGGAFARALLKSRPTGASTPAIPASTATGDEPLDCLMRTGHAEAAAFIRAPLYTRKEHDVLDSLVQKLAMCVPAGEDFRASTAVFRSVVAIWLFAETMPAVTAASPARPEIGGAPILPREPLRILFESPPTNGKPGIPALSIRLDDITSSDTDLPPSHRHQSPDLPPRPDPEAALARETRPAINPDTGEAVTDTDEKPDAPDQNPGEKGSPY